MKKKIALLFLVVFICSFVAPASANIEQLFPDEREMGYDIDSDKMLYKKYPVDNYTWDTVHQWFKMEGIKPVTGNAKELIIKAGTDYAMAFIIGINRLAIYLLQYGFNNNLLEPVLQSIDESLAPIKSYFFEQMYGFASLALAVVVIIKFARGRKGEGFTAIFKAVLYTALIFGLISNILWIISFVGGFCDYTALTVLGTMSLAPLTGSDVADLANQKILDLSNVIFKLYIDDMWTFGQFGTISDIPIINAHEHFELNKIVEELFVQPGQSWKDIFLQFPDGDIRKAIVDVFADTDIPHSPQLSTYMLEYGGGARVLLILLALVINFSALILYGIIGLFQMTGTIGIIVLTVAFCILIFFAFLGSVGERILRSAIGWWIFLFFFKIAAAIYLGIPILVMSLFNFQFTDKTYISILVIHMIVNIVCICFIPTIWKKILPFLLRTVAKSVELIGNPKGRIKGTFRGSLKENRVIPPIMRAESQRNKFNKKHTARHRSSEKAKLEKEVMNMSPRQEFKYRKAKTEAEQEKMENNNAKLTKELTKKQEEALKKQKEIQEENREREQQEKAHERFERDRRDRKLNKKVDNLLKQSQGSKRSKSDLDIKPPSGRRY